MLLINCEINLILTWSEKLHHFLSEFSSNFLNNIHKTLCSSRNLSTEDNAKLSHQFKSDFKKQLPAININQNQYLDCSIDSFF